MIRWGFLGAGFVATAALAPAVHAAAGAALAAVAARDPGRARALGPARVHTGYAELLADPDVDAVYISLSNEAHLPWTLAALAAGKHVLCEKPLGLTAAEVATMQAAADAAGRRLIEASWYRWHPRVRRAEQLLAAGAIGRPVHLSAGFTFGDVPAGNYRLDPDRGGGALYDVGCYAASAALWSLGLPAAVSATCRWGPTGVDLQTDALLDFPGGATAQLQAGIDSAGRQWLVVSGEAGELELRDAPFTSWRTDPTELLVSDGTTTRREAFAPADPYRIMVEEVSGLLSGGPGWVVDPAASLACARVLDAVRASARAGAAVDLVGGW